MTQWLLRLDRRIIFLLVLLAVTIPLFCPFSVPLKASSAVRGVYDKIESLPEGSVILISADYNPQAMAELNPMYKAFLTHAFRKNHKVMVMTHIIDGVSLVKAVLTEVAGKCGKRDGEDYVLLGWNSGGGILVLGMGQDLYSAFPTDNGGKNTRDIPMLKNVASLKDVQYMFALASGTTIPLWIVYGRDISRFEMGAGCTAVIAPELYPYLQTEQLTGLLGGMKGAADYESLLGYEGTATAAMGPLTTVHILIVFFVILCNILYFATRNTAAKGA